MSQCATIYMKEEEKNDRFVTSLVKILHWGIIACVYQGRGEGEYQSGFENINFRENWQITGKVPTALGIAPGMSA